MEFRTPLGRLMEFKDTIGSPDGV